MGYTRGLLSLAALLLEQSAAQTTYGNDSGPVVDLGYAKYRGNTTYQSNYSTNVFYGIRFAQAPVGELRWQPPMDIEAHNDYNANEVIDAQSVSPSCVQGNPAYNLRGENITTASQINSSSVTGQEDCLLLNVYTPSKPKSTSLPVLVMIHGGGYTLGDAASNPGQAIVNASQGEMIYVSTQYRLGAYGFLSSSEIRENGVANAGLLDQRSALAWIQRNIRAFGGDPGKVTITGGSAGGGSVMDQMILYGGVASPPFRAVLSEYPWWQPFHNNTILEQQYRSVLKYTDCTDLQCLRTVDPGTLKAASQQSYLDAGTGYGDFYYGPSVDGDAIRDLPSNEFKQGHFTKVPLLVDHDGFEGVAFSNQTATTEMEITSDAMDLFPYAKQSFFDRLYQLYPRDSYNSTFFQRQQFFGDFIINCPTYYMATATADAGLATYKLVFNAGSQLHGATGVFIYSSSDVANNVTLANYMKDWVISFTTHLDPNAQSYTGETSKPYWPMYNPALGNMNMSTPEFAIMDVNYTMVGAIPDLDASAQCDFFHASSYDVRN